MPPKDPIDIIIPSYNAKHLLKKNLPFVIKHTINLGKIIVIDNGSEDGTEDWLHQTYPNAIVIRNKTNLGYTTPINQGVAVSQSRFFVLLNNDVRPDPNYLSSATKYFKDDLVFAVTFNEKSSSWPKMSWSDGKMQFERGVDESRPVYSGWASGGSAIFRRQIWDQLGGYDNIYSPWYWEDIDIGYRAWKMGFKIIWEPSAIVVHDHESTSKTLNKNYVNLIKQRNELLFNWLNIKDPSFRKQHLLFLLKHTTSHPGYIKVVLAALIRRVTHNVLKRKFSISDQNALTLISQKYEN